MKARLIIFAIQFIMCAIALGVGVWYLSSSIGGDAITYTSVNNFMTAIGVENGDIASANGCFLCGYIEQLFSVIGNAAEMFWTAMVDNIWILLALGFGLFLIITTGKYIYDAAKPAAKLDTKEIGFRGMVRQSLAPRCTRVNRRRVNGRIGHGRNRCITHSCKYYHYTGFVCGG